MSLFWIAAAATSVLSLLAPETRSVLERCGVDEAALATKLAHDEQSFDQDPDGGWRAVAARKDCHGAAAELIKAYILFSRPYPAQRQEILRWHAGQSLAFSGRNDEAAAFFRGAYKPGDDHADWNFYVDGTLAFLTGDRAALVEARENLSAVKVSEQEKASRRAFLERNPNISMPDGFVERPMNLPVLDALIACFGRPYAEAYGSPGCRR